MPCAQFLLHFPFLRPHAVSTSYFAPQIVNSEQYNTTQTSNNVVPAIRTLVSPEVQKHTVGTSSVDVSSGPAKYAGGQREGGACMYICVRATTVHGSVPLMAVKATARHVHIIFAGLQTFKRQGRGENKQQQKALLPPRSLNKKNAVHTAMR